MGILATPANAHQDLQDPHVQISTTAQTIHATMEAHAWMASIHLHANAPSISQAIYVIQILTIVQTIRVSTGGHASIKKTILPAHAPRDTPE